MNFYKENWFRWIWILPGSILTHLIVMFPVHWFVMFINYQGTHDNRLASSSVFGPWYWFAKIPSENLELLFSSFLFPLIVITYSSKIAPKYKLEICYLIAIGVFISHAYMDLEFINDLQRGGNETFEWIRILLTIILALSGTLLGLRNAYKEDKKTK